jgi:hypothetical protein
MRFVVAEDPKAATLRDELINRAMDTDAVGLMTANVWLWAVEQPDPEPRAVVSALFAHAELPGRQWLEPSVGLAPWVSLSSEAAAVVAVQLLTRGQSLEIPAFQDEQQAATQFVAELFAWVGSPLTAFGSMEHRPNGPSSGFVVFRVPHWFDEGLVLVGSQRVAALWFVGTD